MLIAAVGYRCCITSWGIDQNSWGHRTKCTLISQPWSRDLWLGRDTNKHTGFKFNFFSDNLQEYLNGLYQESRQYDLVAFWKDVCRDFTVKELLLTPPYSNQKDSNSGAGRLRNKNKSGNFGTSGKGLILIFFSIPIFFDIFRFLVVIYHFLAAST
jgi:hypothetical protein